MSGTHFQTAAVIGTGMMGPGIALTLALGGVRTVLVSRSSEGAAKGLDKAREQANTMEARGVAEAEQVREAISLLSGCARWEDAVAAAELVIESIPEDLSLKQDLFAHMDAVAPAETVLASDTSGLSITAIAARCSRPERVLTAHFWNPAHLVPLVEIVRGEQTSYRAVTMVRDLLQQCGKTPVVIRQDRPGQLGNRLQMALVREAANIIAEGIADAEDIDAVIRHGLGLRMPANGILEHMDMSGLDLALRVLEYVAGDLYNEPRAPQHLRDLVDHGDLGVKTGKGFYDWSVKNAAELKSQREEFLIEVLKSRRGDIRS